MTLLVTTLYNQHGKAKAKAAEVAESLTKVVGHTVAIEYDWKFVDQVAFKSMSTDIQKSILVNTLSGNLVQCLTGPQDSLAIALATSAPLRDLIKNIVKIVFSYDYANAISSAVGAGHLNIFVEGNSLHFKSNLNALHLQNNGDWGISLKLFGLVTSQPVTLVGESGSVPQVSVAADQVVISPPIVNVPLTLPSAAPVSISKYKRVGGNPGGNGTTTFLYLSLEKVKKRIVELGTTLSSRVGSTIAFEVDLLTLVKDSVFMKESEADQKAFLMAAPDSWAGALYASTNGVSTVESALKIQVGVNKVKWIYTSSNKPTLGWSFLEICSSGSELLIKCAIADIDQKYGVGVECPVAAASASTVIPAQQNCSPVPSVIPAVITLPPVSVQPVCDPVAHRSVTASTPSASNSSAASNCPVPGSRLATVGGKPGGNGTVSFLYASLERLKKMVNDTFPKEFSNVLGSARISFSLDVSFAKNPAFTNHSEADQRAFVSGPITHQISSIACQMVSGDHLLALFQNPEHSEYCSKITKITFSYSADVASDESWSFELSGNCTEIKIQIAIGSVDVFPDASTWGVAKKASACLALLRQIKAEEARVVAEREAKIALEKKMAEEDRLRLLKEEADRKHAAEEAAREKKEADLAKSIALLETSGVYQGLKSNRGRLQNVLHEASISGDIEFCVDSRFSYLEQLNWNKVGDQGATLLAIATSPKSLFTVLTDAAISIIESGTVGAKRLMETYKSFDLNL